MWLLGSYGPQWCTSATSSATIGLFVLLPDHLCYPDSLNYLDSPEYSIFPKSIVSVYSQKRPNNTEEYVIPILVILKYSLPPRKHHADNEIETGLVANSSGTTTCHCADNQSQTNYSNLAMSKSIERLDAVVGVALVYICDSPWLVLYCKA